MPIPPINRRLPICAVLVATAVSLATAQQGPDVAGDRYRVPRTPDGQPDIAGVWTNTTITPLERPDRLRDQAAYSELEASAVERESAERRARADAPSRVRNEPLPVGGRIGSYNTFWYAAQDAVAATRQTSLVVEPQNGRVPTRPAADARARWSVAHRSDTYHNMSPYSRCITRGIPGSMLPNLYNTGNHILQTPGFVVIRHEMMGFRVVPLDNRPPIAAAIGQWMGDARGRWEGETLVVETTGFTPKGWITPNGNAGRMHGVPVSPRLRVVERFTRVSDDRLDWEVTIEDREVYTAPWTIRLPLAREADYVLYEYACHEGNHAVLGVLGGARADERQQTQP